MTMQETPRSDVGVDVLVLTVRAPGAARAGAIAIDVVAVLGPLVAGILIARTAAIAGALLIVLAVLVLTGTVLSLAVTGRTLGALATGIRTVSASSAAPAGRALPADLVTGRLRTLSLRTGRDPLSPALAAFEFPVLDTAAPQRVESRSAFRRPALVELDSGQKLALESALIIGRSPEAPLDAPASVYVWPDMSRTLSKSHARLEWDGTRAWATDLGSTNGTLIHSDTGAQPLQPYQRTPLPTSVELSLGDRTLTVVTPS